MKTRATTFKKRCNELNAVLFLLSHTIAVIISECISHLLAKVNHNCYLCLQIFFVPSV